MRGSLLKIVKRRRIRLKLLLCDIEGLCEILTFGIYKMCDICCPLESFKENEMCMFFALAKSKNNVRYFILVYYQGLMSFFLDLVLPNWQVYCCQIVGKQFIPKSNFCVCLEQTRAVCVQTEYNVGLASVCVAAAVYDLTPDCFTHLSHACGAFCCATRSDVCDTLNVLMKWAECSI